MDWDAFSTQQWEWIVRAIKLHSVVYLQSAVNVDATCQERIGAGFLIVTNMWKRVVSLVLATGGKQHLSFYMHMHFYAIDYLLFFSNGKMLKSLTYDWLQPLCASLDMTTVSLKLVYPCSSSPLVISAVPLFLFFWHHCSCSLSGFPPDFVLGSF